MLIHELSIVNIKSMLVKIYPQNPNQKEIDKVVSVLQEGGLVIYPTDTLYGIGCDALNVRAVEKICQIKGINPQKITCLLFVTTSPI